MSGSSKELSTESEEEEEGELKWFGIRANQALDMKAELKEGLKPEDTIIGGIRKTHDKKDNIDLLKEMYHMAKGCILSNNLQDSCFFDLTQTRTPVLGNTMLHVAACNGNNDVVDLVVKKAPELLFLRNKNEDTALHVAARAGHNLTIQKLLEAYSDFQRPEIAKEWLQFEQRNNAEGLIYLIRLENNQGNTMLHEAMMCSKCKGPNIFQVLDSYRGESVSESCYESALTKINKANQSVLYLAVETGHKDTVILILNKCHKDVMPQGISPFMAIIMKRDKDMLDTILTNKQEWIHLADVNERVALHYAAFTGFLDGVVYLIEQCKSCMNGKDKHEFLPLHLAAHGGNVQVLEELLKYCSDPTEMLDKNGRNILHIAAKSGKYEVVQYILKTRANIGMINQKDVEGNTPLHLASKWCHPRIVYDLTWNERVNLRAVNQHKQTALDIVNEAYQVYQSQEKNPSIRQASIYIYIVNALQGIHCHKDVMPQGISPFMAIIMKRDKDMLDTILTNKQEWIHLADVNERVALHYAAFTGFLDGVVYLIEQCKSCMNGKDKHEFLPLHLAAHGGNVQVLEELLKYCSDPTEMLDKNGRNILHIAAKSGKYEVVQYILKTRANIGMINQKDVEGNTPLHLASKWCHPRIVYDLTWNERVNLRAVNQHKQTALDIVNEAYQVYQSQEKNPSIRQIYIYHTQRLTYIALKSAGAKRNSRKELPGSDSDTKVEKGKDVSDSETKVEKGKDVSNSETVVEKGKDGVSETKITVNCKDKGSETDPYKDRVETLQVVSTLIVTASVAACLAVPGEADGAAHNINHTMFHFFIFSITISLFSSISATVILVWTRLGVLELLEYALDWVLPLLGVSLISLSLAFMSGLYTVISKKGWLATTFLVITLIFVVAVSFLYILFFLPSKSTMKPLRYISFYPFIFLAWMAESGTNHETHNM
ncbi:protein ACCELERATED CELL DEATH 6 [Cajanus cajan]|uniref:protein ACCELERATED CELL DEATH 6 n=1 Tax=Cajanus cajan TaxID=3821 RepID=UPI0010FACEAD|nr:protein ACCELERATED CELL DEATH 6 [Cajanus cajan]